MKKVEYRVRPITRYVVTRYEQELSDDPRQAQGCGSQQRGTYDNAEVAYQVAYALCKAEHDVSGEPPSSMNFIYPEEPRSGALLGSSAVSSQQGLGQRIG